MAYDDDDFLYDCQKAIDIFQDSLDGVNEEENFIDDMLRMQMDEIDASVDSDINCIMNSSIYTAEEASQMISHLEQMRR